jgi:hypothetical protein
VPLPRPFGLCRPAGRSCAHAAHDHPACASIDRAHSSICSVCGHMSLPLNSMRLQGRCSAAAVRPRHHPSSLPLHAPSCGRRTAILARMRPVDAATEAINVNVPAPCILDRACEPHSGSGASRSVAPHLCAALAAAAAMVTLSLAAPAAAHAAASAVTVTQDGSLLQSAAPRVALPNTAQSHPCRTCIILSSHHTNSRLPACLASACAHKPLPRAIRPPLRSSTCSRTELCAASGQTPGQYDCPAWPSYVCYPVDDCVL